MFIPFQCVGRRKITHETYQFVSLSQYFKGYNQQKFRPLFYNHKKITILFMVIIHTFLIPVRPFSVYLNLFVRFSIYFSVCLVVFGLFVSFTVVHCFAPVTVCPCLFEDEFRARREDVWRNGALKYSMELNGAG